MSHSYQGYSVEDFDKYDCLKLSKSFYLVLLFVLRGYLVWLMSVTNMRDRVGLMQWLYPEMNLFFLSLFSGAIGLFVLLVISLRRPNAYSWVENIWPYSRTLLVIALSFDFTVSLVGFFYWQLLSLTWVIGQGVIVLVLIKLCFTSERLKINLAEFPHELPEK